MNNRDALLAAAKRSLYDKGYVHTTARDLATDAGVSLAAIGYHFRSKEALLNEALVSAIDDWGQELERSLAGSVAPNATPLERFEAFWARVIDLFATYRQLWIANFEVLSQLDRLPPEVRQHLAAAQHHGRREFAAMFQDLNPAADAEHALAVGSFYIALLLGVMGQWVSDPTNAPSGHDLAVALRAIAASFGPGA